MSPTFVEFAFKCWYRVKGGLLGCSFFLAIMFVVEGSFWSSVSAKGGLTHYSQASILIYIFLSLIASQVTACTGDPDSVSETIQSGRLDAFLLRPKSYIAQMLSMQVGLGLARLFLLFPLILILEWRITGHVLWLPAASLILTLPLAAAMNFLINQILSSATFWFKDSYALVNFKETLFWVASGTLIPLDLFPQRVADALTILPGAYLVYFPAKTAAAQADLLPVLCIQIAYCVFLYGISLWVWNRGIKHYQGYGG